MTTLTVLGSGGRLKVSTCRLVVAGYTGKDAASVARHIEELAEIGVAPPASVPAFYELDPSLLSTEPSVLVTSPSTSGEVEPVLVRYGGALFLGVGSDHTDRALEIESVRAAKAACPKPLAPSVVELGERVWGGRLLSTVDGAAYQSGALESVRDPADLLERLGATAGDDGGDLVMFLGTVPLLGGQSFTYGEEWALSLELADGTQLGHTYTAKRG